MHIQNYPKMSNVLSTRVKLSPPKESSMTEGGDLLGEVLITHFSALLVITLLAN